MTDGQDSGTPLRVVSERSLAEVEASRALEDLRWPLIELAANMLRVIRGAGKPSMILGQMVAVLESAQRYRDLVGCYPSDYDLASLVSYDDRRQDRDDDWSYAINLIVRGSLQFGASTLLGQSTQQAAGRSEMIEGVAGIEAIRARNRSAAEPRGRRRSKEEIAAAEEMDRKAENLTFASSAKRKSRKRDRPPSAR